MDTLIFLLFIIIAMFMLICAGLAGVILGITVDYVRDKKKSRTKNHVQG